MFFLKPIHCFFQIEFIKLDNLLACKFISLHWCISIKLAKYRSSLLGVLQYHLKQQLSELIYQRKDKFITETVLGTLLHMCDGDLPVNFAQYQAVVNMMPIERVMPNKLLISLAKVIYKSQFKIEIDGFLVKTFKQIFEIYLPKLSKKTTKTGAVTTPERLGYDFSQEDLELLVKRMEKMMMNWEDELKEQYKRAKARLAEVIAHGNEKTDIGSNTTLNPKNSSKPVSKGKKRAKDRNTLLSTVNEIDKSSINQSQDVQADVSNGIKRIRLSPGR